MSRWSSIVTGSLSSLPRSNDRRRPGSRILALSALLLVVSQADVAATEPAVGGGEPADAGNMQPIEFDPAPIANAFDIVVAEHVLISGNGKIKSWDEFINEWKARSLRSIFYVHPAVHLTNGAIQSGRAARYVAAARKLKDGSGGAARVIFESVPNRPSRRYDAIRTSADLVPKREHIRTGVVRDATGKPVTDATIVLMPAHAPPESVILYYQRLRDPLNETWTRVDNEGRFQIASPDQESRLAIIARNGFTLSEVPEAGEPTEITLLPYAEIQISSADNGLQLLSLQVNFTDVPQAIPGFAMFGIAINDVPRTIRLPPGNLTVKYEFNIGHGLKDLIPAETRTLKSGERSVLVIPAPDPHAKFRPFAFARPQKYANPFLSVKTLRSLGKPTEVKFVNTPFEDALMFMAEFHNIPIRIDNETINANGIALNNRDITLEAHDTAFHWVLKATLKPANLAYYVDTEGIVVTTREKAAAASKNPPEPEKAK